MARFDGLSSVRRVSTDNLENDGKMKRSEQQLGVESGVTRLVVCAYPIIGILFGRGAFDAESVRLSAQALMAYAVGLPAYVAVKALAPAMFARGDTTTPMRIGLASVGVNLALNLAFMAPLQHLGPALATSLASAFNAGALAFVLTRRGQFHLDAGLRQRGPRIMAAAAVMAAVLALAQLWLFANLTEARGLKWIFLGTLIALGMVIYGIVGHFLGAFNWRAIRGMLRRRAATGV